MPAVATEAGVGKRTVFDRDRDGVTGALIDEYMRAFQDEFLRGAPPLGPGAPPQERLLSAVAPPVLERLHSTAGVEVPALQQSVIQLIRGISGARASAPAATTA